MSAIMYPIILKKYVIYLIGELNSDLKLSKVYY
jgi:hypothetical protein